MAYDNNPRLFDRASTGADPSVQHLQRLSSAWQRLDSELRLSLVETALKPAGRVFTDGFPAAL